MGLGEEAAEEAGELALRVLGDERRVAEVREEEPREHVPHLPAAPPAVDHGGDARVVGRLRVTDRSSPVDPGQLGGRQHVAVDAQRRS